MTSLSCGVISLILYAGSLFGVPFEGLRSSGGTSGTIRGSVADPTGAAIPGVSVIIQNPISHYTRAVTTDAQGKFEFDNIPFNNYHVTVTFNGFQPAERDVDVRSPIAIELKFSLTLGTGKTSIQVKAKGGDLVETDPFTHTDVDRDLFQRIPIESQSSSLSSLVTLVSPGVAADSNGLFHEMGDHAQNSFSVDGQPITDQQSKVFSNQIPVDSVQSTQIIEGAPPAEYGGKTSLVIVMTTRSGLGVVKPHGSVNVSYGSFGTSSGGFDLSFGSKTAGDFISANGWIPAAFSTVRSSASSTIAATRPTCSIVSICSYRKTTPSTSTWNSPVRGFKRLTLTTLKPPRHGRVEWSIMADLVPTGKLLDLRISVRRFAPSTWRLTGRAPSAATRSLLSAASCGRISLTTIQATTRLPISHPISRT